jgi:hypothetical protein
VRLPFRANAPRKGCRGSNRGGTYDPGPY